MENKTKNIYKAIVWKGEKAGERLELAASNLQEARAMIEDRYGENVIASIWNEADANKPR